MNINAISSLFPSLLQTNNTTSTASTAGAASSLLFGPDASSVSPAASFLNQLQQLQQNSTTQFQQVISQITGRLQQAATVASNNGNTARADQLNQLATTFQNAASGGPLPTAQDLQQAGLTGHHHHHGGGHHGGGQANLLNSLQAQNTADSQSLASSIFGSVTSAPSL